MKNVNLVPSLVKIVLVLLNVLPAQFTEKIEIPLLIVLVPVVLFKILTLHVFLLLVVKWK